MAKDLYVSVLFDCYAPALSEKQRELIEFYYNEDLSLSEISANVGITRQGVRDGIKRSEGILWELEQKLGFAKRFKEIDDGLEKINELLEKIDTYNKRLNSGELGLYVDEMSLVVKRLSDLL